jgi:hypothetical protein
LLVEEPPIVPVFPLVATAAPKIKQEEGRTGEILSFLKKKTRILPFSPPPVLSSCRYFRIVGSFFSAPCVVEGDHVA